MLRQRLSRWLMAVVLPLTGIQGCNRQSNQPFAIEPGDLWIRNVTVVSMERDRPLPNTDVVIRGERIAWVGTARASSMDGVRILDGSRRYLVPGLIDGHVHVDAPLPGMSRSQRDSMPDVVRAYQQQLPRSYLYFGFTTVIALGVKDRTALTRVRAAELGPRVWDCGDPLVMANGYPMRLGPAPQRFDEYPNFLYDSSQASSIPAQYSAIEQSPEAAVDRVRAGAGRCVKLFVELGHPDNPWPVPTEAMIGTAREAARRSGLPLLMHANSLAAHQIAAATAPAAVAHGLWMWPGLLQPGGDADTLPAAVREVLDAERSAGIAYMPTLRVIAGLVDLADSTFLEHPLLRDVVPSALQDWYRTSAAHAIALESNPGGPTHQLLRSASALGARALAYMSNRGGRIVFGSDTPAGSVHTNPPGFNGYLELLAMEAAGLSPRQVLTAATIENARLFGLDQQIGTVEAGKSADLLLLEADPLHSTSAFGQIHSVILGGRVVPRTGLAASSAAKIAPLE